LTEKNPRIDAFLGRAVKWRDEMEALRAILLGSGLTEVFKWGKPCYAFENTNVAIIQPFKEHCALLFFKGALLKDPEGILVKPGENSHVGRQIRFTDVREVHRMESVVASYLQNAIEVEKSGLKLETKAEVILPAELLEAFDETPALRAAFEALTPGRQREYVLHIGGAKQSATRASRVEKCAEKILAGKGFRE
jgi:uncharacterized protein YdeI (YjbR/CyaY-like superfamily)